MGAVAGLFTEPDSMPGLLSLIFFGFLFAGTAAVLLAPTGTVVRSRGVVVALRLTGDFCAGCSEVELDVMVRRPEGGQFAARQRTLIPDKSLGRFVPGSVVDMYYRHGDESSVAVGVTAHRPPRR